MFDYKVFVLTANVFKNIYYCFNCFDFMFNPVIPGMVILFESRSSAGINSSVFSGSLVLSGGNFSQLLHKQNIKKIMKTKITTMVIYFFLSNLNCTYIPPPTKYLVLPDFSIRCILTRGKVGVLFLLSPFADSRIVSGKS